MSRALKFRAYNKQLGKMRQVEDIALDPELGGVLVWGKTYVAYDTGEHEADKDFWKWDDIELMQFTGLLDKNGKEVYEGDIVKGDLPWTEPHAIIWPDDYYEFIEYSVYPFDPAGHLEVIGNIYETPNLLKEPS